MLKNVKCYKGIFLHVIPIPIIVPCSYYANVVFLQYRGYVQMEPNFDCPSCCPAHTKANITYYIS